MKKRYRKTTVHPTPPLVSEKLAFLPAAILAITAALSQDEQEALAYLISCPSGNFSSANNRRTSAAAGGGADHPPSFNCYCFNCYTSYWVRWDSSPNRQLIHQVIDAYEDGLQSKKEKNRGERKKANKDSCCPAVKPVGAESRRPEVIRNGDYESDLETPAEDIPGGDEDGYCEEKGAVRSFVSFLGEKIWNVWT